MGSKQISNPNGAFGYTDSDDQEAVQYNVQAPFVNGSTTVAISKGDVVVLDATITASVNLAVRQADVSADDPALIIGVAAQDIPASSADSNEVGLVTVFGYAHVNVGAGTVAAGELASFHATTDGAADGTVADSTSIAGDYFGVFLGANDLVDTDFAPVWVSRA